MKKDIICETRKLNILLAYKDIFIYYIGYVTIKDSKYLKIKYKSFIPYYQQS